MINGNKAVFYCQPCCNYLSKMGRRDEEQAVFEQRTISNFKKRNFTALRIFDNYIIMTNVVTTQEYHECGVVVFLTYFCVNSTCCSGQFHVNSKHFKKLKNLALNILKEKKLHGLFFP